MAGPSRHQFRVFPGNISKGDHSPGFLGFPRVLFLIFPNSWSQSQSGVIPGNPRDLCTESVARSPDVLLAGCAFILHVRLAAVTAGQSSWKRTATFHGPCRPLCKALDNGCQLADISSSLHDASGGRFPALRGSDLQVGLCWRCSKASQKGGDPKASCIEILFPFNHSSPEALSKYYKA